VFRLANLGVVKTGKGTTGKDELKVEFLTDVSDVNDAVTLKFLSTVPNRSHICCVVVKSAITLLDD